MAKKNNLLSANYYHFFIMTWRTDEGIVKLMISYVLMASEQSFKKDSGKVFQ